MSNTRPGRGGTYRLPWKEASNRATRSRGSKTRAATQLRSVEGKPACLLAGHLANDHKPGVRGIWIIGPPGVGKTHSVISAEPSLYRKAQNKWWDGYVGQPAVLIDDFDETGASLHHYLKLWADRWAHTGEIKGGHVPLCYDRLYVTSNFSLDQVFKGQPLVTLEALKRRFAIHYMAARGPN